MNAENRRQFLRRSTCGVAALGARRLRANPLVLPIGLELYTVRNELEKDFAGTIKKVAAKSFSSSLRTV
jgi:hypothetical protein